MKDKTFKIDEHETDETVAVVKDTSDNIVGYLTAEHEEAGLDIKLDMAGFTIIAI